MGRFLAALLLVALALPARPDSQLELAIRALRQDRSMKVRAQAALVLGQRRAREAVPALCAAVEKDDATAVRMAAAAALGRIGDRSARRSLEAARASDPEANVRDAAARALELLGPAGPLVVSIEEPSGEPGGPAARAALRSALEKHLAAAGFEVVAQGGVRLKPSVVRIEVDDVGGKTVVAVTATLVAVEQDGRMAAMLEGSARLKATGPTTRDALAGFSARALDATARTLAEDLAARLGER